MRWPTLASLLWAIMGGLLTLWGRRHASRAVWAAGATLLVVAALKLVLLDFGSLGQLTNILAVIAAGAVFMLVGWLAPIPPPPPTAVTAAAPGAAPPTAAAERPASPGRKTIWTIVIVAVLLVPLVQCTSRAVHLLHVGKRLLQVETLAR
jgi:hypothetical protein